MQNYIQNKKLKNLFSISFIPILIIVIFSIPHFYQSFLDIDEGIYASVSNGMWDGKVLYKDVWDHKPPLIFILFTPVAILGPSSGMVILRFVVLLLKLLDIYLLYKILSKFKIRYRYLLVLLTIVAFLLSSTVFEGESINSETFFLPLILITIYRTVQNKRSWIDGIILFLAFILKFQPFSEILFILLVGILINLKNTRKLDFKNLLKAFLGFSIPLIIIGLVFIYSGNFNEAFYAMVTVNFEYIGQYSLSVDIFGLNISRRLLITFFYLLLTVVIYGRYFFFNKRKFIISDVNFLLINVILFEQFTVLYPSRTYAHYLIQIIPAFVFSIILTFKIYKKIVDPLYKVLLLLIYFLLGGFFLFVFTISSLARLNVLDINPPHTYYADFLSLDKTKQNTNFSEDNRILKVSNYFKANYSGYESYYLYTKDPWIFTLANLNYTNKYFYYVQMYYNSHIYNVEKITILSSKVIFIENDIVIRPSLKTEIEGNYKLEETFDSFGIYIKKEK